MAVYLRRGQYQFSCSLLNLAPDAATHKIYQLQQLTAFSAFLCVIIIFLCPETYPPILIKRLAISLRASTGDHRIISRLEVEEQAVALAGVPRMTRWKRESIRVLGTPFIMLATEPIVGLLSLFMALTYGLGKRLFLLDICM